VRVGTSSTVNKKYILLLFYPKIHVFQPQSPSLSDKSSREEFLLLVDLSKQSVSCTTVVVVVVVVVS